MAVVADRVIVELEAKLDRYEAGVRRAEQKFDAATRKITGDAKLMEREVGRNADAIGLKFRALAGTLGAAFSAQQVAQLADSYTKFTNQLKIAGLEGQGLAGVQEKLFQTAQQYGVGLESLGGLFGRLSQGSKELGASQNDLLKFTHGVAAALKVQGGSAADTSGAVLQLTQALGGTIVRAEEFNSINEGARPILQTVANGIDRFGGSVSKLRNEVIAGKVTSQEFFQAFLKGTDDLEGQASRSSTTISASFTILTNALTKYVGEADQSNGATATITAALKSLAENLDTVTTALGVLAAVMIGRFAAGMVAGAASSGLASTAIFALQARAVGAATTMEALALVSATTGRALLAAFGGPVGLAITALTLGIAYFASTSGDAQEAADSLSGSIGAQTAQYADLQNKQAAAAAAQGNLDATQRAAIASTAALTGEANLLGTAWGRVAALAKAAALEQAKAAANTARTNRIAADAAVRDKREQAFQGAAEHVFVERGLSRDAPVSNPRQALAAAERASQRERLQAEQARRNEATANAELVRIRGEKLVEFKPPAIAAPPAKATKAKKTPKGPKGPKATDPDELARRFADDVARSELDLQQATADALGTVEARRSVERARVVSERDAAARQIQGDKDLTAAQRERLLALNQQVAAGRLAAILADEQVAKFEDIDKVLTGDNENQQSILRSQLSLAETSAERRTLELRLLDLQYQEEKLRLESIANNTRLNDAEREIARRALATLETTHASDTERTKRDTAGPLEKKRRELDKSTGEIKEMAEQFIVDELDSVQKSLVSAIEKKIGVKDPLLSSLLNFFIEQVIIKPLTDALAKSTSGAPGGGGGGFFAAIGTALGSIFKKPAAAPGRASGGNVVAGQLYRVNEGGGAEGFRPSQSGQIIPLGRMREAGGAGGSTPGAVTVRLILSGDIEERIRQVSGPVAIEVVRQAAPVIIEGAVGETLNRAQRPQM